MQFPRIYPQVNPSFDRYPRLRRIRRGNLYVEVAKLQRSLPRLRSAVRIYPGPRPVPHVSSVARLGGVPPSRFPCRAVFPRCGFRWRGPQIVRQLRAALPGTGPPENQQAQPHQRTCRKHQ